jgi:hypothetical protein
MASAMKASATGGSDESAARNGGASRGWRQRLKQNSMARKMAEMASIKSAASKHQLASKK